jgi:methionyl-tRNA synthetase
MLIQRLDPAKFVDGYDIKCQPVYPWPGVVEPPFGAVFAVVEPGRSTKHHNHQEGETFFIVRGQGRMRVGDEVADLQTGDVVFQRPFQAHTIENSSPTEDLVFVSVYWEDTNLWAGRRETAPRDLERPRRTLVTAAPPTPNGDLHLGHLSGPYLAGDIHARYLRQRGVDATFAIGTDDNQSYVQTNGDRLGLGPQEAADQLAGEIKKTLDTAGIELGLYARPNTSPTHVPLTQAFFRRLWEQGKLVERESPAPWCDSCDRYLFEAWVKGSCPHCGETTGGNSCEGCGRPNDCADLGDPTCTRCGSRAALRLCKRLYFPLSHYEKELRELYLRVGMNTNLRSLCEQILAAGAPDIAVTHIAPWGIPVPVDGYEGQIIFVWCEMAPRYLSYAHELNLTRGLTDDWSSYWKSEEAEVVQCFGFDNGFYYGMLVPALLLAFDAEIRLPAALVMNEFYHLDGKKFSTSRRHAIWGRELIGKVPADVVRFYLAWDNPEAESTSFNLSEFEATVERELVRGWQTWLTELGEKVQSERGGEVPYTGDWTEDHRRFYQRVEELTAQAAVAYEARTFSPQLAARTLSELVRTARRFGKAEEGWRRVSGRSEERRTGLALELLAAKQLAVLAAPLLPQFAAQVWRELGYDQPLSAHRWEDRPTWVPGHQKLRGLGAALYFPGVAGQVLQEAAPEAAGG